MEMNQVDRELCEEVRRRKHEKKRRWKNWE